MKVNLLGKLFFGALAGAATAKVVEALTTEEGREPNSADGNILAWLAYAGDRRGFSTHIRSIRPGFTEEDVDVWYAKFKKRVKDTNWSPG
jgi:hypothetical protein